MRRTRIKKLALLLSLLALGALGLVACGGDDDDQSGAASETDTTTEATAPPDTTATAPPDYTQGKLSEQARKNVREQEQELKAKLSREQVQELKRDANTEAKLSPEQVQALKREANEWARLFSRTRLYSRGGVCNKYTGQPMCVRLSGSGPGAGVHAPSVSAAFQKSFADATVEDIKSERIVLVRWTDHPVSYAAVKFSNGEVVVFNGGGEWYSCAGPGSGCTWTIAEEDYNRRFLEAAGLRE
jgi:hypothetical protein